MKVPRRMKPQCESVQGEFVHLADHEVQPELEEKLQAHLLECSLCEREWRAYQSAVNLLRSLELVPVPEGMVQRIRLRLERPAFWRRMVQWFAPIPQRVPAPVLAALSLLLLVSGVLMWTTWSPQRPESAYMANEPIANPVLPQDSIQFANWDELSSERILPGAEEILSPFKALAEDQERRLAVGATLHEDIVLDITGSEEVFDQIQGILKETRGKMFLMGIRHRGSGTVLKSRMVLQIPLEYYTDVINKLESIGKVRHLFVNRDMVPLPPDRLMIRILGVGPSSSPQEYLQEVSLD